jgi:dihydroneopterin aldolase
LLAVPIERKLNQPIDVSLELKQNSHESSLVNVENLIENISVCSSEWKLGTVEFLASSILDICLNYAEEAKISIEKKCALNFTGRAGIVLEKRNETNVKVIEGKHFAILGLGSNMGNRVLNIFNALRILSCKCNMIDTSFLYESKAEYNENQPKFLNGCCKVFYLLIID